MFKENRKQNKNKRINDFLTQIFSEFASRHKRSKRGRTFHRQPLINQSNRKKNSNLKHFKLTKKYMSSLHYHAHKHDR